MFTAITKYANGYSIKAVRGTNTFKIFKGNKQVGTVEENPYHGPMGLHFEDAALKEICAYADGLYPQYLNAGTVDLFLRYLTQYTELVTKTQRALKTKIVLLAKNADKDINGITVSYSTINMQPTAENIAQVVAHYGKDYDVLNNV